MALDVRVRGAVAFAASAVIALVACRRGLPAVAVCGASQRDSRAIPFTPVNLGEGASSTTYPTGAAGQRVVSSDDEWRSVWRELADRPLPLPSVNFRDSVVIIVASPWYHTGPSALEIEDVRICPESPEIVVAIRFHGGAQRTDSYARSLRAVAVPSDVIQGRHFRFIDIPDLVGP